MQLEPKPVVRAHPPRDDRAHREDEQVPNNGHNRVCDNVLFKREQRWETHLESSLSRGGVGSNARGPAMATLSLREAVVDEDVGRNELRDSCELPRYLTE